MNIPKPFFAFLFLVLLSCSNTDDSESVFAENDSSDLDSNLDCSNFSSVFSINLDPTACAIDIQSQLGNTSLYTESIVGTIRSCRFVLISITTEPEAPT